MNTLSQKHHSPQLKFIGFWYRVMRIFFVTFTLFSLLAVLSGCDKGKKSPQSDGKQKQTENTMTKTDNEQITSESMSSKNEETLANAPTILFLGDSLTEGYDLQPIYGYPAQLQKLFANDGKKINIINGGISGDTSSGGLRRLKFYVAENKNIDVLFIALGSNDGLRGLDTANLEKNLKEIIEIGISAKMEIILAGMKVPQNYGKEYSQDFEQVFSSLSKQYSLHFIPFLLKDVAGNPKYNLDDNIHPNMEGYKVIANNIYPTLKKIVK